MYFRLASQLAIREGASFLKSKDAKHASQNAEYEDSKDDVNGWFDGVFGNRRPPVNASAWRRIECRPLTDGAASSACIRDSFTTVACGKLGYQLWNPSLEKSDLCETPFAHEAMTAHDDRDHGLAFHQLNVYAWRHGNRAAVYSIRFEPQILYATFICVWLLNKNANISDLVILGIALPAFGMMLGIFDLRNEVCRDKLKIQLQDTVEAPDASDCLFHLYGTVFFRIRIGRGFGASPIRMVFITDGLQPDRFVSRWRYMAGFSVHDFSMSSEQHKAEAPP